MLKQTPVTSGLFHWGSRSLYLGQAFGLTAHRNAVAVLCIGLDEPFGIARDPRRPEAGYVSCRTALIPPNTLHHLDIGQATMAFLYVDARSDDYQRLKVCAGFQHQRFGIGVADERACLEVLEAIRRGQPWRDARSELAAALGLVTPETSDNRITDAIQRMRDEPDAPHDLETVAASAKLSPSRFQHLFKDSTGVPFRRYKIWIRMGAAMQAIGAGQTLTEAAHTAGFSSSAHFSAAFRDMFGLSPSRLAEQFQAGGAR